MRVTGVEDTELEKPTHTPTDPEPDDPTEEQEPAQETLSGTVKGLAMSTHSGGSRVVCDVCSRAQ